MRSSASTHASIRAQPSPYMHETCVPSASTSLRCTWKSRSDSSSIAATGSYPWVAHQPVSTPAPNTSLASPIVSSTSWGVFSGWFSSPKRTPCSRRTPAAALRVGPDDLAQPHDQVDVERIREAASRRQLAGRGARAPRKADDANAATREGLPRQRDVLLGRPAPVQVSEPEIDRVEPDRGDPREEVVEAGAEGLDRRERRIRRIVERSPLVRASVAELVGHIVRAHEREHEGAGCRLHGFVTSPRSGRRR